MKEEGKNMSLGDTTQIIMDKTRTKIEAHLKDCHVYKRKVIGTTIKEFWQAESCGRYRRGEATKREFEEYNCDM